MADHRRAFLKNAASYFVITPFISSFQFPEGHQPAKQFVNLNVRDYPITQVRLLNIYQVEGDGLAHAEKIAGPALDEEISDITSSYQLK